MEQERQSTRQKLVRLAGGRQMAWILALALVARVGVNVANVGPNPSRMFKPDSLEYERYARNLTTHHVYTLDSEAPYTSDSFRPPLYVFLLVSVYGLVGHIPQLIVLLQALLGVATTYLIYDLGRLGISSKVGRWAACTFAVAPAPVLYSGFILSETLFTFLMVWSVRSFVAYLTAAGSHPSGEPTELGGLPRMGASGLLLGLATLTRAISQFYIALPICLLLAFRGRGQWRAVAALVGGFAVVVLPWVARNHAVVGSAHISAAGQYNLFYCHAASVHRYLRGGDLESARASLAARVEERLGGETSPRAIARAQVRVALHEIAAHPIAVARLGLLWVGRMLLDAGNGLLYFAEFYEDGAPAGASLWTMVWGELRLTLASLAAVWSGHGAMVGLAIAGFCAGYVVVLVASYGLAALGCAGLIRGQRRLVGVLLMLTVVYLAALPGPLGELRFRVPFVPYLALLMGVGVEGALAWLRSPATAPLQPNRTTSPDSRLSMAAAVMRADQRPSRAAASWGCWPLSTHWAKWSMARSHPLSTM